MHCDVFFNYSIGPRMIFLAVGSGCMNVSWFVQSRIVEHMPLAVTTLYSTIFTVR